MLFRPLVLVSEYHVQLVERSRTDSVRFSTVEASRPLLIALVMARRLACFLNREGLLTLIRLDLQSWQPLLGLPVLPILTNCRYAGGSGWRDPKV